MAFGVNQANRDHRARLVSNNLICYQMDGMGRLTDPEIACARRFKFEGVLKKATRVPGTAVIPEVYNDPKKWLDREYVAQ